MLNVRANSSPTIISSDGDFYNSFVEYIRSNSELLNRCIIVEGNPQQNYYFDIENSSNIVYEGVITNQYQRVNSFSCTPKLLVSEFGSNKNTQKVFFNGIDENKEKMILENIFFKPFLRSIEKNVIQGIYFDKSLPQSSTTDTFTGTKDFDGLLSLVRKLKLKNQNNVLVIHPQVMFDIIDSITIESYLREYLMNRTIEGVRIIESLESVQTQVYGVDPTKICLIMSPELQIQKLSLSEHPLDYIYHIYSFVNGGDMFSTGIEMRI